MNKRFRIPELLGAMLLKPAPPSSTPCFIYYSSVRGAGVKSSRRDVFDPCDDLMRSFRAGFPPLLLLFLFRPDDWAPSAPTVLALFTVWRWGAQVAAVIALSVSHSTRSLSAPASVVRCFPSTSSCCPRGAELPAVSRTIRGGQLGCLPPARKVKKGKKAKESENQFLIKLICKSCIRRCSTFALAQLSV